MLSKLLRTPYIVESIYELFTQHLPELPGVALAEWPKVPDWESRLKVVCSIPSHIGNFSFTNNKKIDKASSVRESKFPTEIRQPQKLLILLKENFKKRFVSYIDKMKTISFDLKILCTFTQIDYKKDKKI